jgi:acetylornithine deacetylase
MMNMMQPQPLQPDITALYTDALNLLKKLIAVPSFSKEEDGTAEVISDVLTARGVRHERRQNNVWAVNRYFDPALPSILLNSHHDTVKPAASWTKDPFEPVCTDGRLYGLGSNDAGASLVSLLCAFLFFYDHKGMWYNLVFAATAEEEISGMNGIVSLPEVLGSVSFAVVGEPTGMHMAVAEKGLLVLDCVVKGSAGHAARNEGDNAIYKALHAIEWFRTFRFPRVSPLLGEVRMNVTMIHAGQHHNTVPDQCALTVDIRVTEQYTHEEILATIREHVQADITPRSMRLRSSQIGEEHPFVQAGIRLGRRTFGSPALSDQALIPVPSVKIGPGDSARSHTADEFIELQELEEGISLYIQLLAPLLLPI